MSNFARLDSFYHELRCFILDRMGTHCDIPHINRELSTIGYQQRILALFSLMDSFNSTEIKYFKQKLDALDFQRKPNLSIFF